MKSIAFLDTVHEVLWNGLKELGWDCVDFTSMEKSEIESQISNFQGLVVRSRFPIDQAFLEKANELEFIARSGAGLENIDESYCQSNGIKLFNAPEGNRNAVAEHALGMLLSLFNKLNHGDQQIRKGIWDREGNRGVELEGKTIGLIGYGNNGAAFAKILSGFNVHTVAYDKYKEGFENDFVREVSLGELKNLSDVISFHIPQNEETIGMFDDEFVGGLKKPIYLINLSRGKIVSTSALLKGLREGRILGACLDVLEFEKASFEDMFQSQSSLPKEFKELLESDKVILSPHVGGWTKESYEKLSQVLLEKIKSSNLI